MLYSTTHPTILGDISLVGDEKSITALTLAEHRFFNAKLQDSCKAHNELPLFSVAKKWLDAYFSGHKPNIADLPLAPNGSEFRQMVWKILCKIPYGQVITYGDIAKKMAVQMHKQRMSAQAVGGAVGHNPISIIIPCHRVVGAGGNLTGYGGGIHNKIKLLKLEGVDTSVLFTPRKGTAL